MPATPPTSLQAHTRHVARGTRLPNVTLSSGPRVRGHDARAGQAGTPTMNRPADMEEDDQGDEESEIDDEGEDRNGESENEGLADEEVDEAEEGSDEGDEDIEAPPDATHNGSSYLAVTYTEIEY